MPVAELGDWLDEQMEPGVFWYAKRLSDNDTGATGGHQAGPYIPKRIAFHLFPSLNRPAERNPRVEFGITIDSHPAVRTVRAIWYNNELSGGTRNETRITGFGGSSSPLLDPEAAGSLAVFAFRRDPPSCRVWVCDTAVEEDRIEDRIGQIEPGRWRMWPDLFADLARTTKCWLEPDDFPQEWLDRFPTGEEMLRKAMELRPDELALDADQRLNRRVDCEYELFRSLEEAVEFPRIAAGYVSMNAFLDHAQSVLQRRRSRSGYSLELQVRQIMREENLVEGRDFSHQPVAEAGKRPDFLFPNAEAYHDPNFPPQRLRMLAVKRTLKDRWRQVLEEADRIGTKHLLTLQRPITESQLREIERAGVRLVVPGPLHQRHREAVRPALLTLGDFLADVRALAPQRAARRRAIR